MRQGRRRTDAGGVPRASLGRELGAVGRLDLAPELVDDPCAPLIAAANGEATVGSSASSSRRVAAPISSSRAGVARCGGAPIVRCRSRDGRPRPRRSPPAPRSGAAPRAARAARRGRRRNADSSAISQSAAIATASRTSRRSVTARPTSSTTTQRRAPSCRLERADVRPHARGQARPGARRSAPPPRRAPARPRRPLDLVDQRHRARIGRVSARRRHAIALFAPLGPTYDRVGAVLSFGQDPLWRRFLVSRIPDDGGHVLDVATGTGLVAERLLARGHAVTGLDQRPTCSRAPVGGSTAASSSSRRRPTRSPSPTRRSTTSRSPTCCATSTTPGRRCASSRASSGRAGPSRCSSSALPRGVWRPLWDVYVDLGLPLGGRVVSRELGRGRSLSRALDPRLLRALAARAAQLELWRAAGVEDVRARRLSLGGGVVMWGTRR